MLDIDFQKEQFKKHIATLKSCDKVKILDFQEPGSGHYRIRFLFEEDFKRLHISGDLGSLTAREIDFENFQNFLSSPNYFEEKVECHSRDFYSYRADDAAEDIRKLVEEYDLKDAICERYDFESEEDAIESFIEDVTEDYSGHGISSKGYDALDYVMTDAWEVAYDLGKRRTGIVELYLLAGKLALTGLQ